MNRNDNLLLFRPPSRFLLSAAIASLISLSACAPTTKLLPQETESAQAVEGHIWILNIPTIIDDEWRHVSIHGKTEYQVVLMGGRAAIRASGKNSASGLIREVEIDASKCPVIEWSWRVEEIQEDADIRHKAKEDVAASIFLIFGDPDFVGKIIPVPTLRYVWTNERTPVDSFVRNPYIDTVHSVALRSGDSQIGEWVTERRNVLSDFKKAFGHVPGEPIQAFAVFTDNDQTKQPVEAYYEWIRVKCSD